MELLRIRGGRRLEGQRRDLREQERFPAGDGGGAAHRPGGRAGQRSRHRGHLDHGIDARARRGQGRASRHQHLAAARRGAADHRGRSHPEPADARLVPAAGGAGGPRRGGEHRQAGRRRHRHAPRGAAPRGPAPDGRGGRGARGWLRRARSPPARRSDLARHAHRHRHREPDDGGGARRGHHGDQQRRARAACRTTWRAA